MSDISHMLNHMANQLWRFAPGTASAISTDKVKIVAHRGAHGSGPHGVLIENTLAAFDLCLQNSVWGVECDVHLTQDGEAVVHHDSHCGRLFNRPDIIIAETPFADLRKAIPDIPLLTEMVQRYAGQMHLMIEVKGSWREQPELPARIEQHLRNLTPTEDYHLLSLVPDHLQGFKNTPPSAFMDVAEFNTSEILRQNRALGHGAVAGSFALFSSKTIDQLQQQGVSVGTGMVENTAILNREIHRKVEWVFTNHVLQLIRASNK